MTLPCALVLPCVFLSTLSKNHVCRVPVNLHTANYGAHGKIEVSGSVVSLMVRAILRRLYIGTKQVHPRMTFHALPPLGSAEIAQGLRYLR